MTGALSENCDSSGPYCSESTIQAEDIVPARMPSSKAQKEQSLIVKRNHCELTMTSESSVQHHIPFESSEYCEREAWRKKVTDKDLNIIPCISAWFDICGYGSLLAKSNWNLRTLRDNGLFEALSRTFQRLGHPFIVGVPPGPSERVLVINDGVARTIDLSSSAHIDPALLLLYVRDLFGAHFQLMRSLASLGLGLRTVLAGGERCQYSPKLISGESILYHSGNPSEYGRALLSQQFVYYPPEFQMNTAFAAAYSIEALGSKAGIYPNRLYVSRTWIDMLGSVFLSPITVTGSAIEIPHNGGAGLSLHFDQQLQVEAKGFETDVFKISGITIHANFDGEETVASMKGYDNW